MADAPQAAGAAGTQPTLKRTLTVIDAVAILIGITIGAGIFSTPQIIATYLSSFSEIVFFWLLAGAFVYIGGLIYAELGTRFPHTGGEYVYISRAFGPYAGFIFGWAQLFIIRTSPAAGLSIIAVDYLQHFIPMQPATATATALGIIALLGYLNYTGVQRAGVYQRLSTAVKIGGLFLLVISGVFLIGDGPSLLGTTAAPTATLGPLGNIGALMMLVVFSYLGWDRVGYVAGEMKSPRRAVPIAMLIGIGTVAIVYVLAVLLYHDTLGMEGVRGNRRVASETAIQLFGPTGAALVALLVIISTTGSTNGTMMTAPRAYYAMARDGLFFRWLDYVHPVYRTPSRAVLAHCIWAAVILLVRQNFQNIVAGMTFAVLLFYTVTTLAMIRFRLQEIGERNCFRVPLFPWLPSIYLVGIISLLLVRGFYQWQDSLVDLAFIATGIPFAFYWCRRNHS